MAPSVKGKGKIMEFKVNFIFVVVVIFAVLCLVYFIYCLINAIREETTCKKYRNERLFCHNCKLAYNGNKYTAEHYKFCPECGQPLSYIEQEDYLEIDEKSEIRFLPDVSLLKSKKENAKEFAFHVESFLVYNDDDDNFTKKEILDILKEILKEEYKIDSIKD